MQHLALFALLASLFLAPLHAGPARHRLVILADMGNEPDEEQQMTHMLLNCNEFELEGLIAVTGKYLCETAKSEFKRHLHPELFLKLIDGYEKVLPNLRLHAKGWPEADYLRSITVRGQERYGIADVGEGRASPGSKLIRAALEKDDPRPVWIVVNAGSNTLAQALRDIRSSSPATLEAAVAGIRVFENGAQDNAGAWICSQFPQIHWIRSNFQTYAYGGPEDRVGDVSRGIGPNFWQPHDHSPMGQHAWLKEHVQTGHGALCDLYPDRRLGRGLRFMEGGGTVPWLGLVNRGLFDIDQPSWGGWSGRFTRDKVKNFWSRHRDIRMDEQENAPFFTYREASDVWTNPADHETWHGDYVPVWRWRPAIYANLVCRADWCVKPFDQANHHPVAAIDGDKNDTILRTKAPAGAVLDFDASASSDPDGDELAFHWWQYEEAGSYAGRVYVETPNGAKTKVHIPTGGGSTQVHLILEIRDLNPIAPLTDYRRIVIDVEDAVAGTDSSQK